MWERVLVICEMWPSISPWNIWDLRFGDWLGFAEAADSEVKRRQEAARA